MIKLLLISHHALPMDVVSSYRTKAYCDYFYENGIFPTLVTHRWERGKSGKWLFHDWNDEIKMEEHDSYKVIRLPRPYQFPKRGIFSKILSFCQLLIGNLDIELMNSYRIYRKFLFDHLKSNQYDVVMAIFSPHYHLKLAYEIKKVFNIPYILDFRDLWDNQVITKSYKPSYKKRLVDQITKYFWKKWLSEAKFFSITGYKWKDYLEKLSGKKGYVIPNGHEIAFPLNEGKPTIFTISYFGRIYPYQNVEIVIKGINEFINKVNPSNFKVQLIGIKKINNFDGSKAFKDKISNKYLKIVDFIPKYELLVYCQETTNIFILPNLNEDNGSFFVKLYDYLALKKPIILAPENGSDNDRLVTSLNAGLVTSSPSKIATFLDEQYQYFLKNENSEYNTSNEKIEGFHRRNQVKKLSQIING